MYEDVQATLSYINHRGGAWLHVKEHCSDGVWEKGRYLSREEREGLGQGQPGVWHSERCT